MNFNTGAEAVIIIMEREVNLLCPKGVSGNHPFKSPFGKLCFAKTPLDTDSQM